MAADGATVAQADDGNRRYGAELSPGLDGEGAVALLLAASGPGGPGGLGPHRPALAVEDAFLRLTGSAINEAEAVR